MPQSQSVPETPTPQAPILVVRRTIRASAERLFDAWTQGEQMIRWWGPKGVRCIHAEIDLRVGGHYRIGNQIPDGSVVWITGAFERITRPVELVYSWSVEPVTRAPERVTIRFEQTRDETEIIVAHERIVDPTVRTDHEQGWIGCLEGLDAFVTPT